MVFHSEAVRALAFPPDGSLLASGSNDGTVQLRTPVFRPSSGPVLRRRCT
ncbi:WD40 repeat domain-containing protein [Streptomyces atratus]